MKIGLCASYREIQRFRCKTQSYEWHKLFAETSPVPYMSVKRIKIRTW